MGLVDKIKNDVKKSGQNKSKMLYFREGDKKRIRFLTDFDDGMAIDFHDSFSDGINVPCQEKFGRDCDYCDMEGIRTRSQYIWSVWDYDSNEVKLFMSPVNSFSPVPALVAMYENYGTLTDRDYVITQQGKTINKSFSVIPQDKVKFRNTKAKALSEKAILQIIDKAYPADDDSDDEPKKKQKSKSKSSSKSNDESELSEAMLSGLSPKELYALCQEYDIDDVKPRKPADYYIDLLREFISDDDDWEDDEEDDWDDDEQEEVDYSKWSPKELYEICMQRKIDAEQKKPAKYYIKLLEEFDAAQDDWADDEDDEDDWDE